MYEFSKNEKYFIKWFEDSGYDVEVKKQWNSKTLFHINGKGLDFDIELRQGVEDIKTYMSVVMTDYLDLKYKNLAIH